MAIEHQSALPTATRTVVFTENVAANIFIGYDGKKCGANLNAIGVTDRAWNNGDIGFVITDGSALIKAAADLTAGLCLKANSSGQAVATTGTTDFNLAVAINACASGDLCESELSKFKL